MAQQETTDPQAQALAEALQELAGYTALPNLLMQELGGENGSTYETPPQLSLQIRPVNSADL